MNIQTDLLQPYIVLELPIIPGSADFVKKQRLLSRIDEFLIHSGLEQQFMDHAISQAEAGKKKKLSPKNRIRIRCHASLSLRCNIARMLSQLDFREMSIRLADSHLLQRFCRLDGPMAPKKCPSKTTLQRMATETDATVVCGLVLRLTEAASRADGGLCKKGGLLEPIRLDALLLDSTCIELNIHFPVDWVLLRDAIRSLLETIKTIRRHGLFYRMPDPKSIMSKANKLCMQMSQASRRGKGGDRKQRKEVLRQLKKLAKVAAQHGERYRDLLRSKYEKTDLTLKEAERFIRSIDNILEKLPAAIHQAHERIIGERQVRSENKILSLFESHAKVYVRGKAGADVEFGLQLLIGESREGLIVDWELVNGAPMNDTKHIKRCLDRVDKLPDFTRPSIIVTDRGFDSKENKKMLEEHHIENMMCPRDPMKLVEKLEDTDFVACQRRRAQTEARIGILKNSFIGQRMPAKGQDHQEEHTAWAILAHNLWVLARLPNRCDEEDVRQQKSA